MRKIGSMTLLLAGLVASAAGAQAGPWDRVDEIIARRGLDTIRMEREDFARRKGGAEAEAGTARLRVAEFEDQADQIKQAIEAADGRVKAAREKKAEGDKVVAEAEKKRLERQRTTSERRRDLWQARYDEARSEAEFAEKATRALDLEYQLERRRLDGGEGSAAADLEKRTAEAQVDMARARESLAGRAARVAERRLSLFEAQQQMLRER